MENGLWECEACTFHNHRWHTLCSMCSHLMPAIQRPSNNCMHSSSESLQLSNDRNLENFAGERGSNPQSSIRLFSSLLGSAISGALAGMFAIVGAFTGAATGAVAGHATDGGILRGASLGAIAGAVLSVELLEACRSFWFTDDPASISPCSMGRLFDEILSGRFVHDQIGPYLLTTYRWQPSELQPRNDDMTYEDIFEMFGPGDPVMKGVSEACLLALPSHTITQNGSVAVENSCCTICLQELLHGEVARSLPHCKHTFHKGCVDEWLSQQGSCPVCRHAI